MMDDDAAAQLRAQVHEATRVLSGSYTISPPRQAALTEEYAERFAAAVERLLDERAALLEIARAVAALTDEWFGSERNGVRVGGWAYASEDVVPLVGAARALLTGDGKEDAS